MRKVGQKGEMLAGKLERKRVVKKADWKGMRRVEKMVALKVCRKVGRLELRLVA